MKRFIPILLVFLFTINIVKAQTGNVTVTTNVTDIISFTIVTAAAAIPMTSADHYQNGNTAAYAGALTVSSNQAWDLSAKAVNANFTDATTGSIPVANFTIAVTGEADGTNNGTLNLTTADQVLIDGASGTTLTSLDLTYGAIGGSAFLGQPSGAYTNTYTFTVSAD